MSTTEKVEMTSDKISETNDVNKSYEPRRSRSKLRIRSRSRSEASSSPRNCRLKSYIVQCRNRSRSRDRLSGSRLRSRSRSRDFSSYRDPSPESCVAECRGSGRLRDKTRRGRSRSKSQSSSPSWDPFSFWDFQPETYVFQKRCRSRSRSMARWSQSRSRPRATLSSRSFHQESNFVQSRIRSKPETTSSMNEHYLENFSQMCSITEQNCIVRGHDRFSRLDGLIERGFKSENQRRSNHSQYSNRSSHREGESWRRTLNNVRQKSTDHTYLNTSKQWNNCSTPSFRNQRRMNQSVDF